MDGLVHPVTQLPIKKPTRIQSNNHEFLAGFRKTCDGHNGVPHQHLEGQTLTASSAYYPVDFCDRAAQLMISTSSPKDIDQILACVCDVEEHNSDWELAAPSIAEVLQPPPEDSEDAERTTLTRLRRIHANLCHPSNRLLIRILKEAKAPQMTIDVARTLTCDVCDRLKRVSPARPANAQRARKLGECIAVDMSYHARPDGKRFLLLNIVDEASRFHVAKVLKEAYVERDVDLGNATAEDVVNELQK